MLFVLAVVLTLISIHALREEGDGVGRGAPEAAYRISIHALREEGDNRTQAHLAWRAAISIHALREEGDQFNPSLWTMFQQKFLSTPSARRATHSADTFTNCWSQFLSTPSARRATVCVDLSRAINDFISIHALREEGDWLFSALLKASK